MLSREWPPALGKSHGNRLSGRVYRARNTRALATAHWVNQGSRGTGFAGPQALRGWV